MKKNISIAFFCFLILFACSKKADRPLTTKTQQPFVKSEPKISIPIGGNTYITAGDPTFSEKIDDSGTDGLLDWRNQQTIVSVYFKALDTGTVNLFLRTKIDNGTTSQIKVTVANQFYTKNLTNTTFDTVSIGKYIIKEKGYVKVDIQGVSKTGTSFGKLTDLILQGNKVTNTMLYVKDNLTQHYYWGRRGPSVHLTYTMPNGASNIEWIYNEVTVPNGSDAIGSYFMANGFDGGYFGMQVKSLTERWILFSVWDPANGTSIATKKGENVITQRFGGEGTGGQAYKIFNWQAGNTYGFLTNAVPDGLGNTAYSSWLYSPETASWHFMATWKRQEISNNKYLTGLYSFLENFNHNTGFLERKAYYGNIWVKTNTGNWYEITSAKFTGDDIAKINFRQDYAGGVAGNVFYLRNCGFFNEKTSFNTVFTKAALNIPPNINFNNLP